MKRLFIAVTIAGLGLAGCGQGGSNPPADDNRLQQDFDVRAQQVAQAWQATEPGQEWKEDLLLLDRPVIGPPHEDLDEAQSSAINSGWYELATEPPAESPPDTVTYDGTEIEVTPWDAQTAYDNLAVGGEPPADCPREPVPDETSGTGDDGTSSHMAVCGVLTITGMATGTETVWSNRGLIEVPVWNYTADGLPGTITQVAFDINSEAMPPQVDAGQFERPDGMVSAAALSAVEETTLTVLLGVGACDENFQPLVYEAESAIVVAGTAEHNGAQMCTDQMLYQPVTVELTSPIGNRMVIDAVTGSVLRIGAFLPA